MPKGKWPVTWLRKWDKKQEEESKRDQYYKELEEDPRLDSDYAYTGRKYPIIGED